MYEEVGVGAKVGNHLHLSLFSKDPGGDIITVWPEFIALGA